MPQTIVRREAVPYGAAVAPGAVLALMGNYSAVHFGTYWATHAHIVGEPGPRGGRRSICGVPWKSRWFSGTLELPVVGYRDSTRWNNLCAECRQGLGGMFNA